MSFFTGTVIQDLDKLLPASDKYSDLIKTSHAPIRLVLLYTVKSDRI